MVTPVFIDNKFNKYIIMDGSLLFPDINSGLEKILYIQQELNSIDLMFSGDFVENPLSLDLIAVKFFSDYCSYNIAMFDGPDYFNLKTGVTSKNFVKFNETIISGFNSFHLLNIFDMEDKTLITGIGIDPVTYEPFVVISYGDDAQKMSPEEARTISDGLQYAAKSAEMDSFFYKSLVEVFDDMPPEKIEQFMDSYRRYRQEYMENTYGKEADSSEESNEERQEFNSENGDTSTEEVEQSVEDEDGEEAELKEAIKEAYKEK